MFKEDARSIRIAIGIVANTVNVPSLNSGRKLVPKVVPRPRLATVVTSSSVPMTLIDIAGARDLLARLEKVCAFGCSQAEDLRQWIDAGGQPSL